MYLGMDMNKIVWLGIIVSATMLSNQLGAYLPITNIKRGAASRDELLPALDDAWKNRDYQQVCQLLSKDKDTLLIEDLIEYRDLVALEKKIVELPDHVRSELVGNFKIAGAGVAIMIVSHILGMLMQKKSENFLTPLEKAYLEYSEAERAYKLFEELGHGWSSLDGKNLIANSQSKLQNLLDLGWDRSPVTVERLVTSAVPALHARPTLDLFVGGLVTAIYGAGKNLWLDSNNFYSVYRKLAKLEQILDNKITEREHANSADLESAAVA
jgi:hypothetical protein